MKQQLGALSFNAINVNRMDSNAGVFIGKTKGCDWKFKKKINAGMGPNRTKSTGKSPILQNATIIYDEDLYDNPYNRK